MSYYPSCDTLAVPAEYSADKCGIFGKNSDRDVMEAQPLIYFPPQDFQAGDQLQCTYISIEQVSHTYGFIGSKPWWMWGLEMGVNECGVSIGNEAEWSNIPVNDEDALLGMDLVRLGLERAATAREALQVITQLLEKYGQGGACKYGSPRLDSSYHNTFVLADPEEFLLLETVGKHWAYRKLKDVQGISNVYSIEDDYDGTSKDIAAFAESRGLHHPGEIFHFSKSFLLMNYHFLGGFSRSQWSTRMLKEARGRLTMEVVLGILRGHYEKDTVESRWSPVSGCIPCVCMHGSEPTRTQSAATMIVAYHKTSQKELMFTCWGSMCPPCCSLIVPFYNTGYIPERLGSGSDFYEDSSFWWRVNRMVSDIESNYERYHGWLEEVRSGIEEEFQKKDKEMRGLAEKLFEEKRHKEACLLLNEFTESCLDIVEKTVVELTERIEIDMKNVPGQIYRQGYLSAYWKKAGLAGSMTERESK